MAKPLGKRRTDDFRAEMLQGIQLETEHRTEEAERLYASILAADPSHPYALYRMAIFRAKRGDDVEALRLIQAAMKKTVTPQVVGDCALILERLDRLDEALATYDRTVILDPNNELALLNRSKLLTRLGQHAKAAASFERLLARFPNHSEAHNSLGHLYVQLDRHREAVKCFERAIALDPNNASAEFNLGLVLLLLGDYANGWERYESRFRTEGLASSRSVYPQPHWDGVEPLEGKTIHLYTEQGLGDCIMFLRYAPLLAARGARVIVGVLPLAKVLAAEMSGIEAVIPGDPLPSFDLQAPLLSLPRLLKTRVDSIPANTPYLHARADRVERWRERVPRGKKLTVGVVWAGARGFMGDRNRSIALERFERLFDVADVSFVSLQRELREGDAERLAGRPNVRHFGEELGDFADTAAIISMVDLVISVDTSVAHLVGAMGKPLWILLPHAPDFRWMLERPDSPWYPTARLFRQPKTDDWESVLVNVKTALTAL
jgi:Flp pilus assembly protein TadD